MFDQGRREVVAEATSSESPGAAEATPAVRFGASTQIPPVSSSGGGAGATASELAYGDGPLIPARAQNAAGGSEVIASGTPPIVEPYSTEDGRSYTQIVPRSDETAPILNREAARLWKKHKVRLVIEQGDVLGTWDAQNRLLTVSADHLQHGNFTVTLKHEIDHMEDSIADASGADSLWQMSIKGFSHRRDAEPSVLSKNVSSDNQYNSGLENAFGRKQAPHMSVSELKSFGLELEQIFKNVPAGPLSLAHDATRTLHESAINNLDIARIVKDGCGAVLAALGAGEAEVASTKVTTQTEAGPVTHSRHDVTAKGNDGNVRSATVPVSQHNLDMVMASTDLRGDAAKIEAAKRKVQGILGLAELAETHALRLIALIEGGGSREEVEFIIEWHTDMLSVHNEVVSENKVKQGKGGLLGFLGL